MARRSIGLAAALVVALVVPIAPAGAQGPPERSTWIVTLRPGSPAGQEAGPLAREYGGEVQHVYEHVLNGFSFVGSADAAAALGRNPNVERVEADKPVHIVGETGPWGIFRISSWAAHQAGYIGKTPSGQKVRVAIVDTGIMATHSDLSPNVATNEGYNCIKPGTAPNDDHGHGTHVAGTVAAAYNGSGVVGVATDARLVAMKVIDSTGNGTDAQVICGLDHVAALAADGVPTVVNMSLGEGNRPNETACGASSLHTAICNLVNQKVTVVAAAGNDGTDAVGFVPAAWDEVIGVSAYADFDGTRSSAGCQYFADILWACDDTLTDFSNYGSVVDVTAPGAEIFSTYNDGGWTTMSGTSMASPHVAGTAALVLGANPSLTPADVRSLLMRTGECPDGAQADSNGTCAGHGQWTVGSLFGNYSDLDGIAEPLVNAYRASTDAGTPPPPGDDTTPPTVSMTAPAANAVVKGTVSVSANASDNVGVTAVAFYDGSTLIGTTDTTAPFTVQWATSGYGAHTLTAKAYDAAGNSTTSSAVAVTVDNVAPTATLTSPTDGSTVSGTVTLGATASDTGSSVSKVEFLVDGGVVGSDTSDPYTFDWNSATVANSTHTLAARSIDAAGNLSAPSTVSVTTANSAPATVMSVSNLVGWGKNGSRSWATWAEVWIVDQTGAPVSGATVTLDVTGGATATRTCTTDTSGYCTTSRKKVSVPNSQSTVTWTTTNVTKNGATWDGDQWGVTLTR